LERGCSLLVYDGKMVVKVCVCVCVAMFGSMRGYSHTYCVMLNFTEIIIVVVESRGVSVIPLMERYSSNKR